MCKYECCIDRVEFMDDSEKTPQSIPTSPSHRRKSIRLLENRHRLTFRYQLSLSGKKGRASHGLPVGHKDTEGLPSLVSEDKR
jgi:hypothetical protein